MSNKTKIQGHNTALESLKNILAVPMEKHGMYVWRKFKYEEKVEVTNPSFTINFVSGSSYVDITNANFDLRKIDKTKVALEESPLVGFSNNGSTPKISWLNNSLVGFAIGSNTQKVLALKTESATTGRIVLAGVLSNAVSTTATISYSGKKTLKEAGKGEFVAFAVSDVASTYPDGGVKDGYWYEKEKGTSAFLNGYYTKSAVDKFTFATDTSVGNLEHSGNSVKLKHSLGAYPKLAVLIGEDIDSYGSAYLVAAAGIGVGNGILRGPFIYVGKYYNPTGGGTTAGGSDDSAQTTDADYVYIYLSQTVAAFEGGKEYTLITFA